VLLKGFSLSFFLPFAQIYVARKTGVIDRMNVGDGSIVAQYKDYKGSFVGLCGTKRQVSI